MKARWTILLALLLTTGLLPAATFGKWSKIELRFTGPDSMATGALNPFAIQLDVVFVGPAGRSYRVPGFYNGDGRGGADGNVWAVRFAADATGEWRYRTVSNAPKLHGHTAKFTVTAVPKSAKGFWRWGRLEHPGTAANGIRYLKFRDGPYWLKAGCDDPENFLGKFKNYNTPAKRRAAIDTLAARGINSLYIMTHNLRGDHRDVWPWLGRTEREAMANGGRNARFDIAKLEEWRALFEYMQTKGVVPYLVLEDDSAWKGYDHARYYREIIARFGHLPALVFNFGEEHNENYRLPQALDHLATLAKLDPYHHPRGIHNVNRPTDAYIDAPHVDFTAIQTGSSGSRKGLANAIAHNRMTLDWLARCKARGRRLLVVNFDEGRPEEDRRCWWSVYLAGGVWEAHVNPPYDRPMSAWAPVWKQLGGARAFMETLPFWQMQPRNDLVKAGRAFCLAQPGEVYALYFPVGGTAKIQLPANAMFKLAWWNPANGRDGKFEGQSTVRGGVVELTTPGKDDWAARLVKIKR